MLGSSRPRPRRAGEARHEDINPPTPQRPSHFNKQVGERTSTPEPEFDLERENDLPAQQDRWPGDPESSIAVHVVAAPPQTRDFYGWSTDTITAVPEAQYIGGLTRIRTRMRVRNLSTQFPVYLTVTDTDATFGAYVLPAGESEEFLHNGNIAVSSPIVATQPQVSYFVEYLTDDRD